MFRRLIGRLSVFVFIAVAPFAVAETVEDDVKVSEVVGKKATPQKFQADEPVLGPRHNDPDTEFQPMHVPMTDNTGHSNRPREMVSFNLLTRETTHKLSEPSPQTGTRRTPSGAAGALLSQSEPGDLSKDFSSLYLITDPAATIFPRHVRISMTFVNTMGQTINASCSATMIDAKHVLTAAHCIFMEKDKNGVPVNDWATSVRVDPGYNFGPNEELGSSFGVQLHTWTGWTQDFDYEYDVAVIDLDRPVGALSGWRGLGTSSNFSWFESGVWSRYSYPGSNHQDVPVYDGQQMYGHVGTFDHDEDPEIGFDRDMYRGTSGGGAIRDGSVWAVRSHARLGAEQTSWDIRVTSDMFADIGTWLSDDRPATPDLIALDVQSDEIGAGAGFPIEGLNFLVHNYSTASFNGTVYYTVVLSVDDNISMSDEYITSGSALVNLGPQGSARVNIPAATAIVPGLPTGDYTVGVIITNTDFDTSNNTTQGDDALPFGVLCAAQASPVLVNPVNFLPCAPTDVTLNWGSVSGVGVFYDLRVGQYLGNGMTYYTTSSTQHLVTGLTELTRYYWQVRAVSGCGAEGNWSPPFQFTTEGTLAEVPLIYPGPEETCVDAAVDFAWDEIPGAESYRLKIVNTEGGPSTFVDVASNTVQVTSLTPGTRYYWIIKAKDECGVFDSYGPRNYFTLKSAAPAAAVLASPPDNSNQGPDVLFQATGDGMILQHDIEVENDSGTPVFQSTDDGSEALATGLAEGDYRWRARIMTCTTSGDQWGPWADWEYFTVDATAPFMAGPPTSPSHTPGVWSGHSLVNIQWPPATDASGIAAYWYTWDQSPDTTPDGSDYVDGNGNSLEGETADGDNNWFHLVAVDSVGNQSAPMHLGPFFIDLTPPSMPVVSSSLPSGSWQNANDLTVNWEESFDAVSGVAGYSYAWSNLATYVLDDTVDTTLLTSTTTSVSEGSHFFFVKAVDLNGNGSDQVQYTLNVDRTDPFVPQFGLFGTYQSGDMYPLQYNANDQYTPPYELKFEHEYTPDNGQTWYAAEVCTSPSGANCDHNGLWPIGESNPPPSVPKYWRLPWVDGNAALMVRITAIDLAGNRGSVVTANSLQIFSVSGVADDVPVIEFELSGNAPNPFNPSTTIKYAIPRDARVQVSIYDVTGRKIRTLIDEAKTGPARYDAVWNGRDDSGQTVASGMYVYRIKAGEFSASKRMTLLK